MDPILIDECLTPDLAGVARARGFVAMHVTWVNLGGSPDWVLAAVAAERDYVLVTNNRRDFLKLYAQLEVHNGLIIIVPAVDLDEQCVLFRTALDTAERQDSLVNLLIEVHADGSVDVRDWSKLEPEGEDQPGGR
jgi:predicted nuclease of predicted toxin-antitoxin system